ncbi:pseudaminic acid cytidylyltransferase [Lewinella sp. IMCC34191]|uniref:pseudaminic acid cytidylyltransferase n=1 Tax=Lewinella sp. IMCC34191 TaxID=2259172 RepID=UPI000E271E87|nr:pseudaminic acid cytidylyltransferase [Lewinella sp. IMCC34191]
MGSIAIIPARGGSKRIPRKNIRDFLGKPIISYSIEAARDSGLFSEIMVSTDDEEIAEVAREYGATVPFLRSEKTADDFATTLDVLREVHETYDRSFDLACCIYATAPFVTAPLLHRGLHTITQDDRDSVFPVLAFSSPIQRALYLTEDQRVAILSPEYLQTRSQDLQPCYHDCGMFYWYRPDRILGPGKLWTDNSGCILLGEMEAHDIDTEMDWRIAEFKYQLNH